MAPTTKGHDLFRLGPLAEAARQKAAEEGVNATAWVRGAVARVLAEQVGTPAPRAAVSLRRPGASERLRLRFTAPEMEAIGKGAMAAGVPPQAYLAALAIADAQVGGVGGLRELAVELRKFNSQLGPVGVNINQMTRRINLYPGQMSKAEREELARLGQAVKSYMVLASKVVGRLGVFARYDSQGKISDE